MRLKRLLSFGRRRSSEAEVVSPKNTTLEEDFVNTVTPNRPTWKCFSYEEVFQATNGFHKDNLAGKGGYAEVYRGTLDDGRVIAVKRLMRASTDEQKEKEFLQELGTVGHVRHPNVSAFLGFCIEKELHLVFQFSSLGSVASLLHDESLPPMGWKLRYKISVGTAKGLNYLHSGCQRRIIHRDIKTSNVLLTADFEPQISDFGLAKWLPSEWTHRAVAPIEGTFGYLAPEYFMHGIVDEKTDVFAFGVFLLETVSGRRPVDGNHQSLLSWAKPHLRDGTIHMLIDPRLRGDYDIEELKRVAFAASLCIRSNASRRPSMSEVLELMLNGEVFKDSWDMSEEEEEEELWGFDDLECDSPFLTSTINSLSMSSSQCS
ncbi:putative receptor-like serine/threonine-protein kinase [Acorus gramineus]|uniref:Receptor-like serine/threonine-protein kinase n=1 Tax=Acorus gramineus TaxID=55184 RepID=A0AAV9BFZ6_ACOGR|nr:putative receptor-like serine/threonine-protein kinase [Acorus gramineus]